MPGYFIRVGQALGLLGRQVDVAVNEIAWPDGARPDETVSEHTALDAKDGYAFGCLFCAILSVLVQKDHCKYTLSGGPMPVSVYIRAGICFSLLFYATYCILHATFKAVF